MTSLEDEFRNLLGEKYQLNTLDIPFKRTYSNNTNKNSNVDNRSDIPNKAFNNGNGKRFNDLIDIDSKLYSDISLNLDRIPELQPIYKYLKKDIDNLLEKVDKVIECLEHYNKKIDKVIEKYTDKTKDSLE